MLIAAISAIISEGLAKKTSWYKIIFNASQYALSVGLAGLAYQYVGGVVGFQNFIKYLLTVICALVYCLINLILVTIMITLDQGGKINTVWRIKLKGILPTYLAEAPICFLMAIVYVDVVIIGFHCFFIFVISGSSFF